MSGQDYRSRLTCGRHGHLNNKSEEVYILSVCRSKVVGSDLENLLDVIGADVVIRLT